MFRVLGFRALGGLQVVLDRDQGALFFAASMPSSMAGYRPCHRRVWASKRVVSSCQSLRILIWVVVRIMVPFWGTLNIRCRIIIRIQKGTLILTTTHIKLDP